MRKSILCAVVVLTFLALPATGFAGLDEYKTNIKDGVKIIAQSPKPLMTSIRDEYNASSFKPFGVVGGTLKGSLSSLKELTRGVFKVLTFNVWEDNFFSNYFEKEKKSE